MFVLALDTATPTLCVGIVELGSAEPGTAQGTGGPGGATVLAERSRTDSRGHAEVLTPFLLECLAESGVPRSQLGAVIVGCGPGPFTGLRVGMATAAAFGDALGIEVHGVCSLDAIACGHPGEQVVTTDARRKEVYWARYRDGVRYAGPGVSKPADLDTTGAEVLTGSPTPASLVAVGRGLIGGNPAPLIPLYLRRPDAVPTAARG